MKKSILILLIAELGIAYFLLLSSGRLHRKEEARAFMEWHNHPTPETRADFDRQKHRAELEELGLVAILFFGMAGATLAWIHRGKAKV